MIYYINTMPKFIDYLSIDTEGKQFEILKVLILITINLE